MHSRPSFSVHTQLTVCMLHRDVAFIVLSIGNCTNSRLTQVPIKSMLERVLLITVFVISSPGKHLLHVQCSLPADVIKLKLSLNG